MLGDVGVGAREQQAKGCELGVRRPHLLPAQLPGPVLLLARARLHRGEVRARRGLGEQLAPHLVAVQHRPQVAGLLLVAAVGDDRRAEHPHADRVEDPRDARTADLLVADDLLDRAQALPAELPRPGHAREPALGELALPRAPRGHHLILVFDRLGARGDRGFRGVLREPFPHLGAIGGLLGSVVEIHRFLLLLTPD